MPDAAARVAPRLQVRTRDRKGLLYDSMRATKDLKVNVSYGKARPMRAWATAGSAAAASAAADALRRRWRCAKTASASSTCSSGAPLTRRWSAVCANGACRCAVAQVRNVRGGVVSAAHPPPTQAATRHRTADRGGRHWQRHRRRHHGAVRHRAHGRWRLRAPESAAWCVALQLHAYWCALLSAFAFHARRRDERVTAAGHHGVQGARMSRGACCRTAALTPHARAGGHPHRAHHGQAAARGASLPAHRLAGAAD